MICRNCNKFFDNSESVCPHCGTNFVKKTHSSNKGAVNKYIKSSSAELVGGAVTKEKGSLVKLNKRSNTKKIHSGNRGASNKFIKSDASNLVGGTVSKGSFIKLEKKDKVKLPRNVERKNFVNYIDYKSAKDEQDFIKYELNEVKSKSYTESDVSSKLIGIEKVRRSPKVDLELLRKESEDKSNLVGGKVVKKYDTKINKKKKETFPTFTNTSPSTIRNNQVNSTKPQFSGNVPKNNSIITIEASKAMNKKQKRDFKFEANVLLYAFVICFWAIAIVVLFHSADNNFFFSENEDFYKGSVIDSDFVEYDGISKSGQKGGSSSEGVTAIVYDNQYLGQFTLKGLDDVYELIRVDSEKQKNNCPAKVVEIEEEIIDKYGIVAVNLCEMDEDFALEIKNVIKYIYDYFPDARFYLTNLTLANVGEDSSFIAAFMPIFTFSTSNQNTGYPVATKTQIILNAKYFLNSAKLKNSVSYGAKSGYFPKNATRSSSVVHEFGHYLSYVALLNYYSTGKLNFVRASQTSVLYDVYDDFNAGNFSKLLLEEAYDIYKKNTGSTDSFYEFRASISQYAVAKDSNGYYIYDETIAEAFHDYYLNGTDAAPASLVIVDVLKSKL